MEWSHTIAYFLLSVPLHLPAGQSNYLTTARPLFCFLFLLLFVYSNTAKKLLPRPAFIGSVTNSLSFKLNPHVYHTLVLIRMNLSIASQAHYNMRQSKSGQPGNLAITTIASSSSTLWRPGFLHSIIMILFIIFIKSDY